MHKTRVMSSMWLFIQLSRPHFLVGGFLMVALGASSAPTVDWTVYALAQLMVTAAQVTAHYVNEYFDREPEPVGTESQEAAEPSVTNDCPPGWR